MATVTALPWQHISLRGAVQSSSGGQHDNKYHAKIISNLFEYLK
jgi:hypothetical protein